MIIVLDIFIIIFLFSVFGITHTYLASFEFKKKLALKYGNLIAFYRIIYNVTATLFFLLIFLIAPDPDIIIYDLNFPFDIIIFILQFLSLIGLFWTFRYIDAKEFLGIGQIFRWKNDSYNPSELDEKYTLRIAGPYRFSRHPVYLFSILFLVFRPTMTLSYLIFLICFIAYFYIGSIYEEKKLITLFGVEYSQYKKRVPRIIPIKIRKS